MKVRRRWSGKYRAEACAFALKRSQALETLTKLERGRMQWRKKFCREVSCMYCLIGAEVIVPSDADRLCDDGYGLRAPSLLCNPRSYSHTAKFEVINRLKLELCLRHPCPSYRYHCHPVDIGRYPI